MKLTLIRHSKTTPTSDIPNPLWGLSDEGISLAKDLSKKQMIKDLEVIYSSLQTKALETSILLAKPNCIPIKTNPDLTEISSFTKKFFGEEYDQIVRDFYEGRIKRIAGGETYQKALNLFTKAIEDIVDFESKEGKENIGIVSHSNILAFFSAQYVDKTPLEIHDLIRMPDTAILDWDQKLFIKFYGEDK